MRLSFSHWLVRQVGYEAMLLPVRRGLHGRTAEAIEAEEAARTGRSVTDGEIRDALVEARSPEPGDEYPWGELGAHWEAADRRPRAGLRFAASAAHATRSRGASVAARSAMRGAALLRESGDEEAADAAGILVAAAWGETGNYGQAVRLLETGSPARSAALRARAEGALGSVRWRQGDHEAARVAFEASARTSRCAGRVDLESQAQAGLAAAAMIEGNYGAAERLLAEAMRTAGVLAEALAIRAQALHALGRKDAARVDAVRATSLAVESADADAIHRARLAYATCHDDHGHVDAAVQAAREANRPHELASATE